MQCVPKIIHVLIFILSTDFVPNPQCQISLNYVSERHTVTADIWDGRAEVGGRPSRPR